MSWLQQHMEEFVKPILGFVPPEPLNFFSHSEMVVIKNIWNSVKREAHGRTILLPGRDVFLFEILARRENYPTIFRPDISRQTVQHVLLDSKDILCLDTGFIGTIPHNLRINRFKLISFHERGSVEKQVFPNLGWARTLALKIESTPKYWESARIYYPSMTEGKIEQSFNRLDEFEMAARLTLSIYKDSTRRQVCPSVPRLRKPNAAFGGF